MKARFLFVTMLLLSATAGSTTVLSAGDEGEVEFLRVPEGGIQPQAVADGQGTLHLIYYRGGRQKGNLFYVTRPPGEKGWSSPIQVNSRDGSANRNEPISRAQLAVDRNGSVHVVWFNMRPAKFWYTRKTRGAARFARQKNLVSRYNEGVETGATVAVDGNGGVFVIWHAGNQGNEAGRAVYITRSSDGGRTFAAEERVNPDDTGVCACCGLNSMVDDQGAVYVSYRAAGANINRDMTLLKSTDSARSFSSEIVHDWRLRACPVSTTALAAGPQGPAVAWETKGQVYFAQVSALDAAITAPGDSGTRQKNPALAINTAGEILLAWAEGSGFRSGGQLLWQIYNAAGEATDARGQLQEMLPDYSTPEVVATGAGRFVIIY